MLTLREGAVSLLSLSASKQRDKATLKDQSVVKSTATVVVLCCIYRYKMGKQTT